MDSRRHKGMGMLIQPVLRPVLQPVLRSIFDPGISGGTPSLTAYVDSISGSDANDGLTPATALASLSAAQTAAARARASTSRDRTGRRLWRDGRRGSSREIQPRQRDAQPGGVGCAAVITFAGMGLLLIGSAVWHEIQVWRGKR